MAHHSSERHLKGPSTTQRAKDEWRGVPAGLILAILALGSAAVLPLPVTAEGACSTTTLVADDFNTYSPGTHAESLVTSGGITFWTLSPTAGSVDVYPATFMEPSDPSPHGAGNRYIDLQGTTHNDAQLVLAGTRAIYAGDTYRITFAMAGSHRSNDNHVDVTVGSSTSASSTYPYDVPSGENWLLRTINYVPTSDGNLVFSFHNPGTDDTGAVIDDFKIQRLPNVNKIPSPPLGATFETNPEYDPGYPAPIPSFENAINWAAPDTGCPDRYEVVRVTPNPGPVAIVPAGGYWAWDSDVQPCTDYQYAVRGLRGTSVIGQWAYTPIKKTHSIRPGQPPGLAAEADSSPWDVKISWNASASTCLVMAYSVYRDPNAAVMEVDPTKEVCEVSYNWFDDLSCHDIYPDHCVNNGYFYTVFAHVYDHTVTGVDPYDLPSQPGGPVFYYVAGLVPDAVTDLDVEPAPLAIPPNQLLDGFSSDVTWTASTGCAPTYYQVYRDGTLLYTGDGADPAAGYACDSTSGCVFHDVPKIGLKSPAPLLPCLTYTYEVRAHNAAGYSTSSYSYTHHPYNIGQGIC